MLAIVSFFCISSSGAEGGLDWDVSFGDPFELNLAENLVIEISNDSNEIGGTSEPVRGRQLVMEDLPALFPDSKASDEDEERYHGANFSFELPPGWTATTGGDRYEGKATIEGACVFASIGWFEDSGIDPDDLLGQVVRAYRSESLRFSVLTAEQGENVVVGGRTAHVLNVYYRYGGQESQKRLVVWSSPVSGRFFYASFWSCAEAWDENLAEFEALLASFKDEISDRYVVLEPRSVTLDGWGTVLQETLQSHHFASFATPSRSEVEVKVAVKAHREEGQVDQLASEEIVSLTCGTDDPPMERSLQRLLLDKGYSSLILMRGGAFWVVVQGPEGKWQAISPAAPGTERGLGTLVGPEEDEWYRGLVVEGPAEEKLSPAQTGIVKDCDPPREVHLSLRAEVNLTWILGLRDLLDLYSYTQEGPDPGSFQRAQICWALLRREGYDALLVTGYVGHPLHPQMWVVVKHPGDEGYIAVKTTAAGDRGGLGEIVTGDERFDGIAYETSIQYTCLHPDLGLAIDPGAVRTPASG